MDVHDQFISNSAICLMFYCGNYCTQDAVIIKLFNMISKSRLWCYLNYQLIPQVKISDLFISNNIWNQLSIFQIQNKCTVSSAFSTYGNAMFIEYVMQSIQNPSYLVEKMEGFLNEIWVNYFNRHDHWPLNLNGIISLFQEWLPSVTEEIINGNKNKLEAQLLRKPSSMSEQNNVYKNEFTQRTFDFNRAQAEVDALRLITKKDIFRFYRVSHSKIIL